MIRRIVPALATSCLAALAGCSGNTGSSLPKTESKPTPATPVAKATPATTPNPDPEIEAGLSKLVPAERKLAEAQRTCPITGEPLGSMGMPPKVVLAGKTVFLCCNGCRKKAEADPDKTLAKVAAGVAPAN